MIGGGSALIAGYFTITIPQRRQQQREDARNAYVVDAFLQATKLAAAKISLNEPIAELGEILRQRTTSLIEVLPAVTVRLNPAEADALGLFHLMIVELDRTSRIVDRRTVLFAYGAAATIALVWEKGLLGLDEAADILASLVGGEDDELTQFFGTVIDKVLPEEIRQKVRDR